MIVMLRKKKVANAVVGGILLPTRASYSSKRRHKSDNEQGNYNKISQILIVLFHKRFDKVEMRCVIRIEF